MDLNTKEHANYAFEQRFHAPPKGVDSLARLHNYAPQVQCNLMVGEDIIRSSDKVKVFFSINPRPWGASFKIELSLAPAPNNATFEQQERGRTERISVVFSAYDEQSSSVYANRQVRPYTGRVQTPPAGQVSFSAQLRQIDCSPATGNPPPNLPFLEAPADHAKQIRISWRAKSAARFNFDRPTSSSKFSKEAIDAANKFRSMIDVMIKEDRFLHATCKPEQAIFNYVWPYFLSMPSKVPPSFWPWLNAPDLEHPDHPVNHLDIMQFPPNKTFELQQGYITVAFARRSATWTQDGTNVRTVPTSLEITTLDPVVQFRDGREYLAHVLGGFSYEEMHTSGAANQYINGYHFCDIYTNNNPNAPGFLVLLNIRPPKNSDSAKAAEGVGLPQDGEQVRINITYHGEGQVWTGSVVPIPQEVIHYGRNLAIHAVPPPTVPQRGRILTTLYRQEAEFHFGHYGSPTQSLRDRITALMTDLPDFYKASLRLAQFWKQVLLAQDIWNLPDNNVTLSNERVQIVDRICKERNLNEQQVAAVRSYFTHRITLVRGPPGTGKSTLIDAIVQCEEAFGDKFWVCTESNTACDVLVKKTVERHKNLNPLGIFRIKPVFQEILHFNEKHEVSYVKGLPAPKGVETPESIMQQHLNDTERVSRVMGLDHGIMQRFNLVMSSPSTKLLWPQERDDLRALLNAARAFDSLKLQPKDGEDQVILKERLEKDYIRELRKVQQRLCTYSKGIFSTAAASHGALVGRTSPQAIIMDEASQFMEAKAVSAILHGVRGGSLRRVLLIGDDRQLPPTVMADRNPFSQTTTMSLFERLIKAGMPVTTLRVQFRMHPSISSICNTTIYEQLSPRGTLTMIDGDNTSTQNGEVARFRNYIKGFASRFGHTKFPDNWNSAIISPTTDETLKVKRLSGSTSAYNEGTAYLSLRTAADLMHHGYSAMDIMVISFYADQVQLLKALFQKSQHADVRVETVDGSQGSERKVVIIDCVTMGAAVGDSMGFLNRDERRFNVAMSRAQAGRIVIAHHKMIASNAVRAGPWVAFWTEARNKNIIIGAEGMKDFPTMPAGLPNAPSLAKVWNDVISRWKDKNTKDKVPVHKNTSNSTAIIARPRRIENYEQTTFISHTGTNVATATQYLNRSAGDLQVALNKFFSDHGSSFDVEEI